MTHTDPQPLTIEQPARRPGLWRKAALGLVLLVGGISTAAWLTHAGIAPPAAQTVAALPAKPRPSVLSHIKSWGYQLQNLDVAKASAAPFDLLIIDRSALDYGPHDWATQTLKRLKTKPGNKGQRLILAYLSIGEAEDYRKYWQRDWSSAVAAPKPAAAPAAVDTIAPAATSLPIVTNLAAPTPVATTNAATIAAPATSARPVSRLRLFASHGFRRYVSPAINPLQHPTPQAPPWLGGENSEWRGNFHVRFWQTGWEDKIFGNPEAILDRIIAAGFNGVYLDRADVYEHWQIEHPQAARDMIGFITRLAAYARRKKPDFAIVLQNAEELTRDKSLRNAIDALAKEDLFYGVDGNGKANSSSDIDNALRYLKLVQQDRRPIMVVEYINEPKLKRATLDKINALGFIPYFAPRELDNLRVKF